MSGRAPYPLRWALPALVLVALVVAWELAAQAEWLAERPGGEALLVPAPSDIWTALIDDRELLVDNGWVTLQEVVLGFALSVAVGLAFAIALHLSPLLRRAFYPLLVASQTGTGYFDAGVQGFELIVIASAVLGGVSLSGGQGSLISAMIGVLILGMTGKGLRLMNVHTTQQLVVTGIVMLVAVYLHGVRNRMLVESRRRDG